MISPLPPASRNFSPPKGLRMNPDDARPADQQKRNKTPVEETSDAVDSKEGPNAKCIRRFAILAEPKPRFHFNPLVINPFIVAIAINQEDKVIKNKKRASVNTEVFLFSTQHFHGWIAANKIYGKWNVCCQRYTKSHSVEKLNIYLLID